MNPYKSRESESRITRFQRNVRYKWSYFYFQRLYALKLKKKKCTQAFLGHVCVSSLPRVALRRTLRPLSLGARTKQTHTRSKTVARHGAVKRAWDSPEFRTYLKSIYDWFIYLNRIERVKCWVVKWPRARGQNDTDSCSKLMPFHFSCRWVLPSWTATLQVTPGLSVRSQS